MVLLRVRCAWRVTVLVAVATAAVPLSGCGAIKGMAINSVADTLAKGTGDTFTRDDDVELIRDAIGRSR